MPMATASIVALLGAGGALGGAKLASDAQGRAAKAGAKSSADALAYQKDVEARRRLEYDQRQALAKQSYERRYANRMATLEANDMLGHTPGAPSPVMPGPTLGSIAGPPPAGMPPAPVTPSPTPRFAPVQPMTQLSGPTGAQGTPYPSPSPFEDLYSEGSSPRRRPYGVL